MRELIRPSLSLLLLLSLLTGVAYPLLVTAVAQAAFPFEANGSLLRDGAGVLRGSALIGQELKGPGHVWSRPSATTPPYDAMASAGSQLAASNPALATARLERAARFSPVNGPLPADLLAASGSGLDPHISPEALALQLPRLEQQSGLPRAELERLTAEASEGRWLGLFGAPRVNALRLTLALDARAVGR